MAKYYDFANSTSIMSYLAALESGLIFVFCLLLWHLKKKTKNGESIPLLSGSLTSPG